MPDEPYACANSEGKYRGVSRKDTCVHGLSGRSMRVKLLASLAGELKFKNNFLQEIK